MALHPHGVPPPLFIFLLVLFTSGTKQSESARVFTIVNVCKETISHDVSLVDGFNLSVTIVPLNGTGNCSVGGCDSDMRSTCPSELALKEDGKTLACRSACSVYDSVEYCCRGTHNSPMRCQASNYTKGFKQARPAAYSYAYDDPTSLFTCTGLIMMCILLRYEEVSLHLP